MAFTFLPSRITQLKGLVVDYFSPKFRSAADRAAKAVFESAERMGIVSPVPTEDLARQIGELAAETTRLLDTADQGRILREGVLASIV